MLELLTEYENRLLKRDINADDSLPTEKLVRIENVKFNPNGEINPFFGLTCIVWITPETKLFSDLFAYQHAIKTELDQAGLGEFFSFLKPASFHMTLCDIVASPTQIPREKAIDYVNIVQREFSEVAKKEPITCQIQGVGLSSTITALVRFEEEELQKIVALEQRIKDAAQVNIRDFTGHISLAYSVSHFGEETDRIKEILRSRANTTFGELTFSQFDLVCFTDMNTYIPLLSINFEKNQMTRHPTFTECQLC